ncbi:MAG: YaaA family protein [Actinomycetes bacterium]
MLLLLPPSEAKVPGGDGPALADTTDLDDLGRARREVLTAVARFCQRSPAAAATALKLPAGSARHDLAANIGALDAPTMPALDRFTGVLFAALDVATLSAPERRRARASTLVFSGAFGVLAGDEPVPLHRVPASASVPGVGGLTSYWKKVLATAVASRVDGERLVVDLRSSDYAAMWQPTGAPARRVLGVRVLEDRGGVLRPMSWSAKHGMGLLARELLRSHTSRTPVRTVDHVAAAAERIGYGVQRRAAEVGGGGGGLDLIVPR